MAYSPLTRDQYQKALDKGFSPELIVQYEKRRKSEAEAATKDTGGSTILSGIGSAARAGLDVGADVEKGAVKGALGTLYNVGRFAQSGINMTGLFPKVNIFGNGTPEMLKTRGTAQEVGKAAEQIGEFYIPAGIASEAEEAVSVGVEAAEIAPKVMEAVGKFAPDLAEGAGKFIEHALELMGKGAIEGTSAGGVVAAQKGSVDREAADAALIASVFPGISAAGKALLPEGKDAGARVINSLIKPLLKDFSYGKNPGRAVAEEGITADSLDELAGKIETVRQRTGEQIGEIISGPKGQKASINLTKAPDPIDVAITKAERNPRTNAALIERLKNVKKDLLGVIEKVPGEREIATQKLEDMTAKEAFEFGEKVADVTIFTGNPSDDKVVNKALKSVYRKTKDEISRPKGQKASINLTKALDPIDVAITKAERNPRTNAALIERLKNVKKDLLGMIKKVPRKREIATQKLEDMTAKEAFKFGEKVADVTIFTGNPSDDKVVNKALKSVYGKTKDEIGKAVPESIPLNEKYADLRSAEIATKYRDKIEMRQNIIKFLPKAVFGAGLITSAATMNPIPLLAGLGEVGIQKALESVRFRTEFGKWLASDPSRKAELLSKVSPAVKGIILKTYGGLTNQEGTSETPPQ